MWRFALRTLKRRGSEKTHEVSRKAIEIETTFSYYERLLELYRDGALFRPCGQTRLGIFSSD